jgi:hypothetical protein
MIEAVGNQRTTQGNVVRGAVAFTGVALMVAGALILHGALAKHSAFAGMANGLGARNVAIGVGSGAVALGALLTAGIAFETFGIKREKNEEVPDLNVLQRLDAAAEAAQKAKKEPEVQAAQIIGNAQNAVFKAKKELAAADTIAARNKLKEAEAKAKKAEEEAPHVHVVGTGEQGLFAQEAAGEGDTALLF